MSPTPGETKARYGERSTAGPPDLPNALAELTDMTEAVTSSQLDYTVVRITNPVKNPATGRIRAGFLGHDKIGSKMSRADIAGFLILQLIETRYTRAMPAISN